MIFEKLFWEKEDTYSERQSYAGQLDLLTKTVV